MKRFLFIAMVAFCLAICSEKGQAQDRNQARQTVSFGVYPNGFLNSTSQGWQKTITVALLVDNSKPFEAISLRSILPVRSIVRNDIPFGEISSKFASKKLLVTISD